MISQVVKILLLFELNITERNIGKMYSPEKSLNLPVIKPGYTFFRKWSFIIKIKSEIRNIGFKSISDLILINYHSPNKIIVFLEEPS